MSDTTTASSVEDRRLHGSEWNRVFDALSHRYRRHILVAIADATAHGEAALSPGDLDIEPDEKEQVTAELVHAHLPRLAEAGYVEWDRTTKTITRGENYDEIAPFLQLLRDHSDELPNDGSL